MDPAAQEGTNDRSSTEPQSTQKNAYRDPDDGKQRFLLELEFIQCLANPTYIHYLAQNRYFEDEAFIGYLKYLKYWQKPEYVKFIMSVPFLCLFKELAHRQQYFFWKNYRNNRLKHILPRPPPEPAPPSSQATSVPVSAPVSTSAPLPPAGTINASSTNSPMQHFGSGSNLPKADARSTMGDRRKRKKDN
ncbi:SOH1 family protein isoform X2 [Carex rostrata]